jgi:hypothetical protein
MNRGHGTVTEYDHTKRRYTVELEGDYGRGDVWYLDGELDLPLGTRIVCSWNDDDQFVAFLSAVR